MILQSVLTSLLPTSLLYCIEKGFSNSQTPLKLLGRYLHNMAHFKAIRSWVWCCIAVFPALGSLRQEDCQLEASLVCVVRSCLHSPYLVKSSTRSWKTHQKIEGKTKCLHPRYDTKTTGPILFVSVLAYVHTFDTAMRISITHSSSMPFLYWTGRHEVVS